jgi:hypothetical protein
MIKRVSMQSNRVALKHLLDLVEVVAEDIDEHWEDDDFVERPGVGVALYEAMMFLIENKQHPSPDAMGVVGQFAYHTERAGLADPEH